MNQCLVSSPSLAIVLILAISFSRTSLAQFEEFSASVDKMVASMNNLSTTVNQTRNDVDDYIPEIIDATDHLSSRLDHYAPEIVKIGNNLTLLIDDNAPRFRRIGQDMSDSIRKMTDLASEQVPTAQDTIKTGADALKIIAQFATTVEKNRIGIALATTAVLAGGVVIGVVLGHFLNHHILTLKKEQNVLYRISKCCRVGVNKMRGVT